MPAAWDQFIVGSLTHWMVLLGTVGLCAALVAVRRAATRRGERAAERVDQILATLLLVLWAIVTARNLLPGRLRWDRSLPLHICDVSLAAGGLSLLSGRRLLQTLIFFFGLGLSSQAFIAPQLRPGFGHLDFWLFWLMHIGIVSAGVYEIAGRGYRPHWGDWQRAMLAITAYTLVVGAIDYRLRVNYGFIGPSHYDQSAAILWFGEWPARIPRLLLSTWGVMALMTLPTTLPGLFRSAMAAGAPGPAQFRSVLLSIPKRYFTSPLSVRS